jgi:hypothetical protein
MMNREIVVRVERITSVIFFVLGLVSVGLALGAEVLGLDLTPGFGMVQMLQVLVGLTLLTMAGFLRIHSLRAADAPRSLQADIGVRLGATGLVFAYTLGWADLIGIGTHVNPDFERPFVGPLQLGGLIVGIVMIMAGIILYYTSRGTRQTSALESLLPNGNRDESVAK